jgi:hypothetical protein
MHHLIVEPEKTISIHLLFLKRNEKNMLFFVTMLKMEKHFDRFEIFYMRARDEWKTKVRLKWILLHLT